jgi:acetyl-CoA carboxylase biotin carboxylase subunit
MFAKVLVANRGEIAVRILRALRQIGIPSVAIYSEADRTSHHVRLADEAYCAGPAPSTQSYLNIGNVVGLAKACGATAIHPGYGFLSENPEFAAACESAQVKFIGPSSASIRAMGRKTDARRLARTAGVSVVPGTEDPITEIEEAGRIAASIGYPVMLKAAAGGGGKGMRRVSSNRELESAYRDAAGEAQSAFRDNAVYIEKCIELPRHIEVQILGDEHGNLIHLGERECSVQRRHQKVIEECPSPLVASHPEMRNAMGEAALRVAKAAGYYSAGTVEFLVDASCNFYFLEMNTRLQVEHPVTEMVTGFDLVELQLRIAAGEPLPVTQADVNWRGWSMECRVYAEDPERDFSPSPGKITRWNPPSGPGIRVDSGVHSGWIVPLEYDPMLAKLAAWGQSRSQAIARLQAAMREFEVTGIRSNLDFLAGVLADHRFLSGELHTGFIEQYLLRRKPPATDSDREAVVRAAVASEKLESAARGTPTSGWLSSGRETLYR